MFYNDHTTAGHQKHITIVQSFPYKFKGNMTMMKMLLQKGCHAPVVHPSYKETTVLPLTSSSKAYRRFCTLVGWCSFIGFSVAFAFDVVDLITGGYDPQEYAKANPLIGAISFCSTQLEFLIASCSILFLLLKRDDILKSAEALEILAKTHVDINVNPIFYATTFNFGWFFNFYFHASRLICLLVNYPVKVLWAYFNIFLIFSVKSANEKSYRFLKKLKEKERGNNIAGELYVEQLRNMRHEIEQCNAAFDRLQTAFGGKLLCDVTLNLSSLCVGVAQFSIWSINSSSSMSSLITLLQILLTLGIKFFCVGVVVIPSICLCREQEKTGILLEKIVSTREASIYEKPSSEEVSLTMSLIERFKTKKLIYSAGGVAFLGPVAISTLFAGVFAFTCFVMDRAQHFKPGRRTIHTAQSEEVPGV
ncbi:hypothetical protein BV898_07115 [Hypsibius exemplaris]|uniref:Uncharacterized protein n=1 Tax=Hypsibius exemplaris TaxID=2072580 RepID=A0A1W0WUI4_HYPEX|nr:hypothetical protein BV898_07115 [Hypsibius exemplaris]